jgi:hypothetical protein
LYVKSARDSFVHCVYSFSFFTSQRKIKNTICEEDLTNSSIVSKGKRICVETRKLRELVLRMHVPHLSSKLSLQAEKAKDFDFSWWLNRRRSKCCLELQRVNDNVF